MGGTGRLVAVCWGVAYTPPSPTLHPPLVLVTMLFIMEQAFWRRPQPAEV